MLHALEIAAPGKQPLIEQIFSLTVKFPTLPSQTLLARAQSLTLAVKVREAVSSLQLTDPGCPSCRGCTGHQKTEPGSEQPSLTGTVRSPVSRHRGHLTPCNTSPCEERRNLTVWVGNEHKGPVEKAEKEALWLSIPGCIQLPLLYINFPLLFHPQKMTRQLKGFVRRSLSAMATRGSTQCAGLCAYSAHTGSGISYNLVEETCLFGDREMLLCLPARSAEDGIPALLSPSLFKPATHP